MTTRQQRIRWALERLDNVSRVIDEQVMQIRRGVERDLSDIRRMAEREILAVEEHLLLALSSPGDAGQVGPGNTDDGQGHATPPPAEHEEEADNAPDDPIPEPPDEPVESDSEAPEGEDTGEGENRAPGAIFTAGNSSETPVVDRSLPSADSIWAEKAQPLLDPVPWGPVIPVTPQTLRQAMAEAPPWAILDLQGAVVRPGDVRDPDRPSQPVDLIVERPLCVRNGKFLYDGYGEPMGRVEKGVFVSRRLATTDWVRLDNVSASGITTGRRQESNGVLIKHQAGRLHLSGCTVVDSDQGVLTSNLYPDGVVIIDECVFRECGFGTQAHGCYLKSALIVVRATTFGFDPAAAASPDGGPNRLAVGHHLKTEGWEIYVLDCTIGNKVAPMSACVEQSSGGVLMVLGGTLVNGERSAAKRVVGYGAQRTWNSRSPTPRPPDPWRCIVAPDEIVNYRVVNRQGERQSILLQVNPLRRPASEVQVVVSPGAVDNRSPYPLWWQK